MSMNFKSPTDVLAYVIPFATKVDVDDYDEQCQMYQRTVLEHLERIRLALTCLTPPLRGAESLDLAYIERAWFIASRVPLEIFPGWCFETLRSVRMAAARGERHEIQF